MSALAPLAGRLSLGLLGEGALRTGENVGGGWRRAELPRPVCLGWGTPSQVDRILLRAAARQAACPRLPPCRPRLPGEHAVGNHGGDSGPRLEEPQLPEKGGVQTPRPPEPRWVPVPGMFVVTLPYDCVTVFKGLGR